MPSRLAALAGLALLLASCSGGPSHSDVVADLTDRVIAPSYVRAADAMAALADATEQLCATPGTESLAEAQQAWRRARIAWKSTAATWFGPVMQRRSESFVDWFPIDRDRIERTAAREQPVSPRDIRQTLAATQRGLGAIEHLLFADRADEALRRQPGRCAYTAALADVAATEVRQTSEDWERSYANIFKGEAALGIDAAEAVAMLVRAQVFLVREVTQIQLGPALGANGIEQDPSAAPAGPAGHWAQDLRAQIEGMEDVYSGAGGLGVGDLVAVLSEEANQRMLDSLAAVLTAIGELPKSLSGAAGDRDPEAQALYDALVELGRTLNTEVVSLLGISVGFSDNDGDSLL